MNWNGLEDTIECLDSLKKVTYPNYQVTVVDNGSEGNDADILASRYCDYVHLIRNDRNYGFAEGNNIAIRYALEHSKPDYFLLLNNDTVVEPEFLGIMVDKAETDPLIGIVGPKVYFHADPDRLQFAGGTINHWTGAIGIAGWNRIDTGQFDESRDSDWVLGCALLVKRGVVDQIGLLYEGYFSYFEEADWCVRCRKAGCRVVCTPRARIWHKGAMTVNRIKGFQLYYMTRNRFLFMKRNSTRLQLISFFVCFFFGDCLITTLSLLIQRRDLGSLRKFYTAIWDGIRISYQES